MRWILFVFIFLMAHTQSTAQNSIVAMDSAGLVVTLKERYGALYVDSCTVVSMMSNTFILTKKNRPSTIYPMSNWAIIKITKKNNNGDTPEDIGEA